MNQINIKGFFLSLTFIFLCSVALSQTRTATLSGPWNSTLTWGGLSVPTSANAVVINNGVNVEVTAAAAAASITFNAGTTPTTLTVNSGFTLTVTGAVTFNSLNGDVARTITGAGTLTCGSVSIGGATDPGPSGERLLDITSTIANFNVSGTFNFRAYRGTNNSRFTVPTLNLNSGTLNIDGQITTTYENAINTSNFIMGSNTTLLVSNATPFPAPASGTVTRTFNAAGATVNYDGAAQTILANDYTNLTISGSGSKTTPGGVNVAGVFSIEGTATNSAAVSFGAASTLQFNTTTNRTVTDFQWPTTFSGSGGLIIKSTGIITMNNAKTTDLDVDLTIETGATLSTNNLQLTIGGDFIRAGNFTAGSSTIVINNTSTQNISGFTTTGGVTVSKSSGTATFTGNISAGALTLGASGTLNLGTGLTHTFSGQISGSDAAATLDGGSSILNLIAATPVSGTFTFNAGTGTLNYSGTTQNIPPLTYNNLSISNSGTKTAAGTLIVGSVLTVASGVTLNMGTQLLQGNSLTTSGTGTLTTQNTTSAPIPSGRIWDFSVNYNATTGNQTVRAGTYNSLLLGNTSGASSPDGNIAVTSLTIGSGATLDLITHLLTGASLTTSGPGILTTQSIAANPIPSGRTWSFTVTYNAGTGAQSIITGTYNTLSLGNTSGTNTAAGNITATTLTTTAGGTFNMGSFQLSGVTAASGHAGILRTQRSFAAIPSGVTWGGTVEYYGIGTEIIGGTYASFISSATGFSEMTGNITVQTALTLNSGIIELVGNTFTIQTTNITVAIGSIDASFGSLVFNVNGTINLTDANPLFGGQPIDNLTLNGGVILNLASNQDITTNLTISSGKLGMAASKVLTLLGTVSMSATNCLRGDSLANLVVLNPTVGTLFFDQVTGPFTNFVKDLTVGRIGNPTDISASFSLGNILKVKGNLTPLKGSINTGGFLTIASDVLGSGRILAITPANFTFNGNVVVERYVKNKGSRRYIFIASPVAGQTVRQAWQDDIFITGPGTGGNPCDAGTGNGGVNDKYNNKGFDATIYNAVTMFSYNQYLPARWVDILSTDTIIQRGKGYRILFRGARGINDANCSTYLQTNTPPAPSEATLNVSGPVVAGDLAVTVSGSTSLTAPAPMGYTLVGNPYASEIDFDAFRSDNLIVNPKYWTFDPNGPDGSVTTYMTYSLGTTTGVLSGNSANYDGRLIASGQAFFLEKSGAGDATVTFKETHKTTESQPGVFKPSSLNWNRRIRVNYFKSGNAFIDNIVIRFSDDPTVTVAESKVWDASTLNAGNFLAGLKGTKSLAIQTRPANFTNDTVGLRVVSSAIGEFKLTFTEFDNFTEAAEIILLDMFMGTQTNVRATPYYVFEITTNTASQGGNRFKLVFRSLGSVMPLSFLTIGAIRKAQEVEVSWKIAFEQNVIKYVIERSNNGHAFTAIGEVTSKGNSNAPVDYTYLDSNPLNGTVYYRVKSIEANESQYSAIVKVNGSVNHNHSSLSIYPNPAKDKITINSNNQKLFAGGIIAIRNVQGTTVLQSSLNNGNRIIDVSNLAAGMYFVSITNTNGQVFMEKFIKK